MEQRLEALLGDLRQAPQLAPADLNRAARRIAWLADASHEQLGEFLAAVRTIPSPLSKASDVLLRSALEGVARKRRETGGTVPASSELIAEVLACYGYLGSESVARPLLLAWLATGKSEAEIGALVCQLVAEPPTDEASLIPVMSPLFRRSLPVTKVFPSLLAGLAHPVLAAPVLDLANYLVREEVVERHPAEDRLAELTSLLGGVTQSLARLEEGAAAQDESPAVVGQRVAASVALAVSLCDALGLIGDPSAAGKLHQAMALGHRRLRTEAAAALARLGDPLGVEALKQMAAEPVARLRVLAYADELQISDKIDAQHKTPVARAEAELISWLAEPTQFGLPPTACELVDRCKQFWPGFDEPVECFLFRFGYTFAIEGEGQRSFSNVGIVGPLVHAFTADLADLSPQDIYAAYAGWQAEHDEIREYDVARLSKSEQLEVVRLRRRLHDAGYEGIEPQQMGYFFGEKALVAFARRGETQGVAIVDFDEIAYFPQHNRRRSLGVREAYCIYKGRKLLQTFNTERPASG